jgi:hypothetical protein
MSKRRRTKTLPKISINLDDRALFQKHKRHPGRRHGPRQDNTNNFILSIFKTITRHSRQTHNNLPFNCHKQLEALNKQMASIT